MASAPTKKEQLRMTCISFALEAHRGIDYSIEKIIEDAELIYEWIIKEK